MGSRKCNHDNKRVLHVGLLFTVYGRFCYKLIFVFIFLLCLSPLSSDVPSMKILGEGHVVTPALMLMRGDKGVVERLRDDVGDAP